MDLSSIVQYDETFPVEIKHRKTGKPVGLTINVTSFESLDAQKAERKITNARMREQFKQAAEADTMPDIDFSEVQHEAMVEKAIAAVKSWDWSDGVDWQGEKNPPCTDAKKREILLHPNMVWVLTQVIAAGSRIENFMGKPEISA